MAKRILTAFLALCLPFICTTLKAQGCFHPEEQVAFVKKMVKLQREPYYAAYKQLLHCADSVQSQTSHALEDFAVPGYYVKPEEHKANSLSLQQDAFAAYCSALAYKLSGKKTYGEKAIYFLTSWATTNKMYSEPDGRLVMSYSGAAMLQAAELMDGSPLWKPADRALFEGWVRNVYQKAANSISNGKNNWGDWGRLGSILSASFLRDGAEVERVVAQVKSDIDKRIAPDGHMPHEVVRGSNSIWYTYFSLAPMTATFWAVYNLTGENLFAWEQDGRSVKEALDYLLYYHKNPSEWKWFKGARVGSPDLWPYNLLEAMAGIYNDADFLGFAVSSRPHVYLKHHFAWVFPTLMPVTLEGYDLSGKAYASKLSDVEKLRKRFTDQYLAAPVSEERVAKLVETIQPDGSWPGIDYVDTTKTAFQHSDHLNNMQALSVAYKKPGSPFKGKKAVKAAIDKSLDFWLDHDFICENWWWNQIGTTNVMVAMLLMLDKELSPAQVEKMLQIVGRGNVNASGARPSGDRIKIAGIQAKAALFKRDVEEVQMLVRIIEGEIKFSRVRGLQYDYSFHHRIDWVNNTLSYGSGYAGAFVEWASNVADTGFRFGEPSLKLLIDYYLDGMCKQMVYGKITDPGVENRDIARVVSRVGIWSPSVPLRLMALTDYRKPELEKIAKARSGEDVTPDSYAKFFWNTDHFVIQRPGFYTSVRMYSSRNANMEVPYNGEGFINHFRGDGTNYISLDGDEYVALTPVNDWMKIPGATVVQLPQMPGEGEVQKWGQTDFVGAVTDGLYGAVGFDFKSPHTGHTGKKAWFFFDEEYLCLGAGLTNNLRLPSVTTMNQCLLSGDVLVKSGKEEAKELQKGNREVSDALWVLHDRVGYFFPGGQTVTVGNEEKVGSWRNASIQTDIPKGEVRKDVFTLYIDHGVRCKDESYQYIVVPGATKEKLQALEKTSPVKVLSNTSALQAAKHEGLGIAYAVFHKHGTVEIAKGLSVTMDSPGILMVKLDAKGAVRSMAVSDPTHELGRIHLTVSQKLPAASSEGVSSHYDGKSGATLLAFDLPTEQYAGKSVVCDFK